MNHFAYLPLQFACPYLLDLSYIILLNNLDENISKMFSASKFYKNKEKDEDKLLIGE